MPHSSVLISSGNYFSPNSIKSERLNFEICILAGGLSQRMGSDKSLLRLGGRTMLQHIQAQARRTGLPVRVIRRDLVPRCGPLGGIYTALKGSLAKAVVFLPCDMPLISPELISWSVVQSSQAEPPTLSMKASCSRAVFTRSGRTAGFPFVLPKVTLAIVKKRVESRLLSIQSLAEALHAKVLPAPKRWRAQLQNVNTPVEWRSVQELWSQLNRFA